MSERRDCHMCGREVAVTVAGKYRAHNKGMGAGAYGPCEASGLYPPGTPPPPAPGEIPGATEYAAGVGQAAGIQFSQPSGRRSSSKEQPMTPLGQELTARFKEMFHQYSNRQERSQQATLGPSEIGSPCDRRLAMSLLRHPAVNPGGDNWASFVGTCVHAGLADMFVWADAGSGRYAVEVPLTFNTPSVPKGTGDLMDRVLFMFDDHKLMGRWSRNKLKTTGPSDTYRVQVHTYAYGARLRGEKIEHVAIIAWPRDESTLDDLYVWTEPYDPAVARDALARVERIRKGVDARLATLYGEAETNEREAREITASEFPIDNSDCRFCPYHMPGSPTSEGGVCNGRN